MSKILFVLSSLGCILTVGMLALLRVFLDPRLYGPAPQQRLSGHSGGYGRGRRRYDYDQVPEPVPVYAAKPAPEPIYAPAAAAPSVPGSYEYVPQQDEQPAAYQAQPYQEQAYEQAVPQYQQSYADGSPVATPYISSSPTAYPTPQETMSMYTSGTPQAYGEADGGSAPVLGSTGQPPFSV